MTSSYTYILIDTLTGQQIDELPLTGVGYEYKINDSSSASATLVMDGTRSLDVPLTPGHCSILIDKGGVLRWGGIVWSRQRAGNKIALAMGDWLSYLDHLLITDDLSFDTVEQIAIARSLVGYAQQKGSSNLGMTFRGTSTSGVNRVRSYAGADQAPVGQRLRELSAVDGGFDFYMTQQWENGYPRRVMQVGYPNLGRTYPASGVVFEHSDVTDWTLSEDAAASASTWYATGAVAEGSADGTAPPTYVADDPTVRSAGFPRLEAGVSFTDIYDVATLQAHAQGKLDGTRLPIKSIEFKVPDTDDGPQPGEYLPGDQALFRVDPDDLYFPGGAEIVATILTVSVAVNAAGRDLTSVQTSPITITEF